jgi:signal transduction histidine kinase
LVWTRDSERALQLEELHYFKAFGASIMSEIAQIEWLASEKSKSDFISSINHELRSPLHGMLASADRLTANDLQPAQYDIY